MPHLFAPTISSDPIRQQEDGAMKRRFRQFLFLLSYICLVNLACNSRSEPTKSTPPDFTGFWKQRCSDAWGIQIKKQTDNLFSVSFCGPGGCFEPGTWMPNTPVIGDPKYRSINPVTLAIQHGDGWQTVTRCTTNTSPVLEYSTAPIQSPSTKQVETSVAAAESPSYVVQSAPTLPFLDWNACPFEGCTYREWTASTEVEVFDTWKTSRKRVATLPPKTLVTGLSGVVITYKPGTIQLNQDLPDDNLRRGDMILTYTYRGEGLSAAWFKGRFYREYDITFAKWPDGSGCLGTDCAGTYINLGEKVWWAKIKMKSGVVGWVNMNNAKFEGIDQFAFVAPGSPLLDARWLRDRHEIPIRLLDLQLLLG
jgi:hypothetical protein